MASRENRIKVVLTTIDKGMSKGLKKTAKDTQTLSGRMKVLSAAIAGGAVAAFYALQKATRASIAAARNWGKETIKLQRITGMTTEQVSLLNGQFRLSGVEAGKGQTGLRLFQKNLYAARTGAASAVATFDALGVTLKDGQGKWVDSSTLLQQVRDRFSQMTSATDRTALALKLFGRGGTDMLPWLTKSKDDMAALTAEIRKYGMFTDKDIEIYKKFAGNQRLMAYMFDMLKVKVGLFAMTLINKVWPVVKDVAEKVFPKLSKAAETASRWLESDKIAAAMSSFASGAKDAWEVAKPLFKALGVAFETLKKIKAMYQRTTPAYDQYEKIAANIDRVGKGKPQTSGDVAKGISSLDAYIKQVKGLKAEDLIPAAEADATISRARTLRENLRRQLMKLPPDAQDAGKQSARKLRLPIENLKIAFPDIDGADKEGTKAAQEARTAMQAEFRKKINASISASVNINVGGFRTGAGAPGDFTQSLGGTLNAARATAVARSGIGSPYRIGGTTPSGWDCSGYVKWVYNRSGLPNFPTYTGNQWVLGRQVPNSSIRPGDQLFFKTGIPQWTDQFGWGHTGIYLGGGQYAHASGKSTGTIISSLASTRYPWAARRHFAKAGADFMTKGPTLILAGEAGREHVKVTPAPRDGIAPSLSVNFTGDIYARDPDEAQASATAIANQVLQVLARSKTAGRRVVTA